MNVYKKSRRLSSEEIEEFGAELDALRRETMGSLGKRESDYIYKVRNFVRYTEIAARSSLMLGWLPPFWLAGTALLGVSKIVENMELGHNVMHGQYDWMNDPSLRGSTYEWDTMCTADNWRQTHNFVHHTYTNVRGMDHDIGYGLLRLFPEQKWEPRFIINPIGAAFLAVTFEWSLALQSLELEKLQTKEKTFAQVREEFKVMAVKMRKKILKDYVFFPALAGPMFLPVLAGNFTANIMRNIWTFSIIFCGHFTEDAETFPKEILENETRGQWYLRQLHGSSNLKGGKIFNFMTGNLSHQIEHHMFPDVPGVRYAELAVKVQEICDHYGQHYNTGSFTKQFSAVVKRIFKYALPVGGEIHGKANEAASATLDATPTVKRDLQYIPDRDAA